MKEKLTEHYYRCDFETSKLLKEAGFNGATFAFYNPTYTEVNNILLYPYNGGNLDNWNKETHLISAPLISVAIEWCKELGYADGCFDYMYVITYKGKTLKAVDMSTPEYPEQDRQQLFYFIQACCKHRIEQLKP